MIGKLQSNKAKLVKTMQLYPRNIGNKNSKKSGIYE